MKRILIVEDDKYFLDNLISILEENKKYILDVAEDGMTALKKLQTETYDVIVLDRRLPQVGGEDILSMIKMQRHSPRVILITGDYQKDLTRNEMLYQGADAFLEKPFEAKALIKLIEKG